MKIIINGHEKQLENSSNLQDIVRQFVKDSLPIIAEVNGKIIKNPHWKTTSIQNGDKIELISFVGGG